MNLQAFLDGIPEARESLRRRLAVLRDVLLGVARGYYTGLYLYGRPGTGKTRFVLDTLARQRTSPQYQNTRLTPMGLFGVFEKWPDGLHVLDDLPELFSNPLGLQILLAALAKAPPGWHGPPGSRPVSYTRDGQERVIHFSGGVIAISNLELHGEGLLEAFKSRVDALNYDPTETEIASLILDIAGKGFAHAKGTLTPDQCREVALFYFQEALNRGVRLDLRVYCDKSLPKYLQHRNGDSESDWRDLVCLSIDERLTELACTAPSASGGGVRRGTTTRLRETARGLLAELPGDRQAQIAAWARRTGRSERTFFRYLGQVSDGEGETCH